MMNIRILAVAALVALVGCTTETVENFLTLTINDYTPRRIYVVMQRTNQHLITFYPVMRWVNWLNYFFVVLYQRKLFTQF